MYCSALQAQNTSSLRRKIIRLQGDTIVLDSMSLLQNSFRYRGISSDTALYRLNPDAGILVRKPGNSKPKGDSIEVVFRVLPLNFYQPYRNKDRRKSTAEERGIYNPFVYTPAAIRQGSLQFDGLNKNGSISRGVSVGNNQDLSVNSSLNLQLSGKLTPEIDISAAITDDNIPIQPDGNTQQLQDFDRVYIQLSDERSKLIVGDFQITRPKSYFMNYNKRLQGGSFETSFNETLFNPEKHPAAKITTGLSMAVARGRFNRNQIQGVEGNQGPYRLRGANNEQYIVILSGSEKVYIDGRQLTRGQENDYIIDYNTAEVTFTSRILMTKDLRIFVEFEYSDRNYARSQIAGNLGLEQGNWTSRLNIYSEQDNKSRPLQQQLTPEQRDVLREAGDDQNLAIVESIDSVAWTTDLVLYELRDTLVNGIYYDSILVNSVNPDSAYFRATFTSVGSGNGDYIQKSSAANGRVFEWVAPVNGVRQGSYAPVIKLIAPIRRQMFTWGNDFKLNKHLTLSSEVAYSSYDLNTFSDKDSRDDPGYAFRVAAVHQTSFGRDSIKWNMESTVSYEQIDKYFQYIERFRNVEFDRDWNLQKVITKPAAEYLPRAGLKLDHQKYGQFNYLFTGFLKGEELNASQHALNTDLRWKRFRMLYVGSLTASQGTLSNTSFYRHKSTLTRDIYWLQLGYKDEFERNLISDVAGDTLRGDAYTFFDRQVFIQNVDTSKRKFNIFYRVRTDEGIRSRDLKTYARGESYGFSLDLSTSENVQFRSITSMRVLHILDTLLTQQEPERTLVNRIELSVRALEGVLISNTYYETGSGLETRKEFSYLEVQPGQGVYSWTDYNGNGIKELNEFEIAAFPDQARYIRVFTPTTDFIRVYSNSFNQSFNIRAPREWNKAKGIKGFLNRISAQSAWRTDRKTSGDDVLQAYNPFIGSIVDSTLITLNQTMRNSVFFNRTDPKFGIEFNFQRTGSKALLNNGLELRENTFGNHRIRWSPGDKFTLSGETRNGRKISEAEYFSTRNYRITYFDWEPKIAYQPGPAFRASLGFARSIKRNSPELGSEVSESNSLSAELKYNVASKGSFQSIFKVTDISFNGNQNTPVAFEMQEGLRTGRNFTWNLSYQRTLSNNMQLSISYDGRKSPDVKTVHVGNVQVRVFF
ncbi:MAG: hypothetical protein KDC13_00980 [Bacteroidetes bacterium]|nr:hypothetical protein [Bacteroidota bacterium]